MTSAAHSSTFVAVYLSWQTHLPGVQKAMSGLRVSRESFTREISSWQEQFCLRVCWQGCYLIVIPDLMFDFRWCGAEWQMTASIFGLIEKDGILETVSEEKAGCVHCWHLLSSWSSHEGWTVSREHCPLSETLLLFHFSNECFISLYTHTGQHEMLLLENCREAGCRKKEVNTEEDLALSPSTLPVSVLVNFYILKVHVNSENLSCE